MSQADIHLTRSPHGAGNPRGIATVDDEVVLMVGHFVLIAANRRLAYRNQWPARDRSIPAAPAA